MIQDCFKCDLCTTRNHIVNSYGNPNADIMFIGEAPGYTEDRKGIPFVGKAGQNLDKYLSICNFNREDIYLSNILKCRPPNNRLPSVFEVNNCFPYLIQEINEVKPKIIVLLGNTAFTCFFNKGVPMKAVLGKWIPLYNKLFIVAYHPSFVMRSDVKISTIQFKIFKSIVNKYKTINPFHIPNY